MPDSLIALCGAPGVSYVSFPKALLKASELYGIPKQGEAQRCHLPILGSD